MVAIKKSTIVLGLSLAEQEDYLLRSAVNLAKNTNSRLVLAHVTLPLQAYMYADKGGLYPFTVDDGSLEELSKTSCLKKLEDLKSGISGIDHHNIETRVVHNDPALGLSQLAKELKATLLICGFRSSETLSSFIGTSTAISLMSNAPCAVLTLPVEQELKLSNKIAFADDLHEETLPILVSTCEFMQGLGLDKLYHLHIKNISEREIDHMVETVNSAIALGTITTDTTINQNSYVEDLTKFLRNKLMERYQTIAEELRQNIKYEALVDFGSPLTKIKSLLEKIGAEIVVFGPHKFFHKASWSFGKLSYNSMLSLGCAVLIIPERTQTD